MDAARTQILRTEEELERIDRDMKKCVGSGVPIEFEELKEMIGDIRTIFASTKERIYDAVIKDLETKANEFYQLLTKGNNVIGGNLKFTKTSYDAIQVEVLTQYGDKLSGASEGFQRMKKIAIVMAIISSKIEINILHIHLLLTHRSQRLVRTLSTTSSMLYLMCLIKASL